MKKIILSFCLCFLSLIVLASSTPVEKVPNQKLANARMIYLSIGTSGKKISLYELATIKRRDLEALTGKKMSMMEKFAFNRTQKRLAKGISADGTITDKKINKTLNRPNEDKTRGFHFVGFILGFVLGLIGVVIAYVLDENEDKRNRVKWAWIGFGIAAILTLTFYIIVLSALFAL